MSLSQVVFDQAQIRMFSYEQAIAVTEAQRSVLTTVQQTALAMVLTPWEDKPVDFRGNFIHNLCKIYSPLLLNIGNTCILTWSNPL